MYPQTDGTTVAWQTDHAAGSLNPPFTLSIENIASGSAGTLSTTTLTNLLSSVLFGSSGGYVACGQGGQLYDWITAGGSVLYSMQPPARCISLARRFTSRMAHRRRSMRYRCKRNEGSRRNIASVTVAMRRSATNPSLTVDITLTNNASSLYGNIFLTEYEANQHTA